MKITTSDSDQTSSTDTSTDAGDAFAADMASLYDEVTGEGESGEGEEEAAAEVPAAKPAKPAKSGKPEKGAEVEEPEAETESEEPSEEETAEGEDDDDADEEAEAPKYPDKFQAILDARKRKLDKAREERDAARQELEQVKAQQQGPAVPLLLAPTPDSPVSDVFSAEALTQAEQRWEQELQWCRDHIEGGERTIGGKPVELSAAQVKARMDQALKVIRKDIPARERYLKDFAADYQTLGKSFPFMAPNHELFKDMESFGQSVIENAPGIAAHPKHLSLIGKAFAMEMVMTGKWTPVVVDGSVKLLPVKPGASNGTGKPKPVAKPPAAKPLLSKPAGAPARKEGRAADLDDRKNSADPKEAFAADMEDFLSGVGM